MMNLTTTTQTTRELSNDELDAELATELPKREEMSRFHFSHKFHHDFCHHHECYYESYCYEPCGESYSSPIWIRPLQA